MDRATVIAELKTMIITECDKDMTPDEIDIDSQLIGGGQLDLNSLDALQISLAIKEKYGVRIEGGPDVRRAFENISSLADYVIAMRAAA